MNISEMHVWFRQYAQQMGMQNTRAILPEQIDLLINTSINDVVNKIIAENISNNNDRVISDNSKIGQINALRPLYDTVSILQSSCNPEWSNEFYSSLDKHKRVPYSINIEEKIKRTGIEILYFVDFSVKYYTSLTEKTVDNETSEFPVRLIDRSYLADTLQDFILAPRFRSPIAVMTNRYAIDSASGYSKNNSDIEIYTGENQLNSSLIENMTISALVCSVIRKPAKVKYVSDANGQNVDCDLPESLHYDILKHAVDLYRLSIAGSIAAAQEQAQNQARENIRNNIREE